MAAPRVRLANLTFLNDEMGWALGTRPCGQPPCTFVVHTEDGGRTWSGLAPLPAYLWEEDVCSTKERLLTPCVETVTFATPEVGFAFGPQLFVTRDGGRTWLEEPGPTILALQASRDIVYRVVQLRGVDEDVVQRQSVARPDDWETLPLQVHGDMDPLLVEGPATVYVIPNVAQGQAIYRSRDSGENWVRLPSPCDPGGANIFDAGTIPGARLAVLCAVFQETAYVRTSADAGATFRPAQAVPVLDRYAGAQHIGAASTDVLLVSDDSDNVQLTLDHGRTWEVVATLGSEGQQRQLGLGYQSESTAHVIAPPDRIGISRDRGRHWSFVHVG